MISMYISFMMTFMLKFTTWNVFFKQHLDELEHPSLVNEFTSNKDEDDYEEQAKDKKYPSEEK